MNNKNSLPHTLLGLGILFTAAGCTSVSTVERSPEVSINSGSDSSDHERPQVTVTERNTYQIGDQTGLLNRENVHPAPLIAEIPSPADTDKSTVEGAGGAISTATEPHDLWDKLRTGFTLEFTNPNDPVIRKFESWYSDHPKYFDRLSDRAYWYLPYVLEQVQKRDIPAEIALLPAIESAFRPDAVSRSNAVGMWQFIAATGTRFGLRRDWWMDGRRDLVESTRAALDYLEYLSKEFDQDWELVLASYNAGEGKIRREVRKNRAANKPTNYSSLNLSRETREYVPKLFAVRNIINNPEKYGIKLKSIPDQHTLKIVDARTQTDLTVAASLIPITDRQLYKLNYGYKRGVTPPSGPHNIVVPAEYADKLITGLDSLSFQQRLRWARHQVRKGEYLGRIARKHGVTVDSIMQANQLATNLIKPGQELKIPLSTGYYKYARASVSDVVIQDGDSIYIVQKGDSLWNISRVQGISLDTLMKWNGLSKHDLLFPGQQLVVGKAAS